MGTKKETLSDKILSGGEIGWKGKALKPKDVKEFLKDLKEEFDKLFGGDTPQQILFRKKIDNLAGPELIDNPHQHEIASKVGAPKSEDKEPEDEEISGTKVHSKSSGSDNPKHRNCIDCGTWEGASEDVCEDCGHSESHMNLYDDTLPSMCKHRNKNGHYDCECKIFKPSQGMTQEVPKGDAP